MVMMTIDVLIVRTMVAPGGSPSAQSNIIGSSMKIALGDLDCGSAQVVRACLKIKFQFDRRLHQSGGMVVSAATHLV